MTPEEFRKVGHQLVDWIADYRTKVADFPVMARTAPGEVKEQLPAGLDLVLIPRNQEAPALDQVRQSSFHHLGRWFLVGCCVSCDCDCSDSRLRVSIVKQLRSLRRRMGGHLVSVLPSGMLVMSCPWTLQTCGGSDSFILFFSFYGVYH